MIIKVKQIMRGLNMSGLEGYSWHIILPWIMVLFLARTIVM
jgi:hypothetical protein